MATFNSIVTFTGKADNIVGMKGEDGKTYLRKNVKPANPKTAAQVDQRVKLALAGLLSKLTPNSAIYGLGVSKRKRRARFTSNIIKASEVTTVDGIVTAKLDPAKLVFSEGSAITLSAFQASFANGNLTMSITPAEMPEGIDEVLAIAVICNADDGTYYNISPIILDSTHPSASIPLPAGNQANIYYVPILQSEGASSVTYERAVSNIAATDSYAAKAEILTSGVFNYGGSTFASTVSAGN